MKVHLLHVRCRRYVLVHASHSYQEEETSWKEITFFCKKITLKGCDLKVWIKEEEVGGKFSLPCGRCSQNNGSKTYQRHIAVKHKSLLIAVISTPSLYNLMEKDNPPWLILDWFWNDILTFLLARYFPNICNTFCSLICTLCNVYKEYPCSQDGKFWVYF